MDEPESDIISNDGVPEENSAEFAKKKRGLGYWFTVFFILLIIIFLLLLFWPTKNEPLTQEPEPGIIKDGLVGAIRVYDAEYLIKNKSILLTIGRRKASRGVVFLKVDFKIRNISTEPRALQKNMINLVLSNTNEASIHDTLTEMYYDEKGKSSPWGEWVGSGKSVNASAIFIVYSLPNKYNFKLHSFDWTVQDYKEAPTDDLSAIIKDAIKSKKELNRATLRNKAQDSADQ